MPRVSVIVPVYNVEIYLSKCLDSLISQTLEDIEIICVNDASLDSSLEILKDYASKDSRIKIISLPKNQGLGHARNIGIESAVGEYIGFVDSDDWVDVDFYEKLYNSILKNNVDVACATIIRKRETYSKYRVFYNNEKIYETLEDKINALNIPKCSYVWNKLYRTEKIKDIKFREEIYFEDVYWSLELLKKIDKIVTVPNTNYYYRVRENSIVKRVKSSKRQQDFYNSQCFLADYYQNNGLKLPLKYKNITKNIKYFWNIPILKTKECGNIESFWLFSVFPIWFKFPKFLSFKFMDSHYFINLFGITIRLKSKSRSNLKYRKIKEYGLNTNSRSRKITVSLTSFPQRINYVHYTIESLLTQSVKPDKLYLWLAKEQFPNLESDLPENLLNLKKFGLTINWCEDIRSYKKLVPSLVECPEDIIITFDDDIYYDKDTIKNLYEAYLANPQCISSHRGYRVKFCKDRLLSFFRSNEMIWNWQKYKNPSLYNTIIGCGGVLYPPNSLYKDVVNSDKFLDILPTQDDIWFWAMAVLQGTKIQVVDGFSKSLEIVPSTQNCTLCKINTKKGDGLSGNQSISRILKCYPEILNILEEVKEC